MSEERKPTDDEPHATETGRKELEEKLSKEGLDAKYLLCKLQEIFGVTNAQAFEHLDYKDYLQLETHLKQPWEKRAMRKLLHIPEHKVSMKKLQDERLEEMKKNQKEAQASLTKLEKSLSEGNCLNDDELKKKKEALYRLLEIQEDDWASFGKGMIEQMQNELDLLDKASSEPENLEDDEILIWASGGLALEGIYMTNNPTEILKKKEHLIRIPEKVRLFGPEQKPMFHQKDFSSSTSESIYTSTVERLGVNFSCMAKAGLNGIPLGAGIEKGNLLNSEQKKTDCTDHNYFCTTKYSYIPLASCHFQKDQIKLSISALEELKHTEKLLSSAKDTEKLQIMNSRFGDFFSRFGSHANQGPIHFGGIFWWKASAQGFKASKLEDVKNTASESLTFFVGTMYNDVDIGIVASKTAPKTYFQKKAKLHLHKDIQLSVSKTGGPVEVENLKVWKSGLVANNKTWCVIDRGFKLIPVWDIILANHRNDFKDVYQISIYLTKAYEALTKENVPVLYGNKIDIAIHEAKRFVEDLESWKVTCADEQLMKLIAFKLKLSELTRNNSVWITECLSSNALPDFLTKVIEFYGNVPSYGSISVKCQMSCILVSHINASKNVWRYASIISWINNSDTGKQHTCIISDSQLMNVLRQCKDEVQIATYHLCSSEDLAHKSKLNVTRNISRALFSLLKALRETQQKDIELLFILFVERLGYIVDIGHFCRLLGLSDIDFMLNEMQSAHKTYTSLKEQDSGRAHAFLLHTGLRLAVESNEVASKEKNERWHFMMDHLKDNLSKNMVDLIQKYNRCKDLEILEKDLHSFAFGISKEESDADFLTTHIVKELEEICQKVEKEDISTTKSGHMQSTDAETQKTAEHQQFFDLFARLGLANYYPKKMKTDTIKVIDQYALQLHGTQPSKESETFIYFFQRLMMMDYNARNVCFHNGKIGTFNSVNELNVQENEDCDSLEDFLNDVKSNVLSKESSKARENCVHPMDVQMAIYHCADDFMRQCISKYLSACQFALPFLVPDPCTTTIEFPLLSFAQEKKMWHCAEKLGLEVATPKHIETFISKAHVPLVSFLRFGKSSYSKSELLNNLLTRKKHNIFFHRHCLGGSNNSVLMNGLAEIFWYCPSGSDYDKFDKCIAFTNLHGDAREHRKQVSFLGNIATINIILLSKPDLNEIANAILNELLVPQKLLIFIFTDQEHIQYVRSGNRVKLSLKNRNEAEVISELTAIINNECASSQQTFQLEDSVAIAKQNGFFIYDDKDECKKGKAQAETVLSILYQQGATNVKEDFLPLQGTLWNRICKKEKELTCLQNIGNKSVEQHRSDIKSEKQSLRCKQLKRAYPLYDPIKKLITNLLSQSEITQKYFLLYLKVGLDNFASKNLTELRQQYNACSKYMTSGSQNHENHLDKRLKILSDRMNACMLGLEHLLREIGQIYEALDALQVKASCLLILPQVAANLMFNGHPIELMDGDAAHVSLEWIGAVLDALSKKVGDKKLFVLSVIGVQSTGKSTLLNTMFGLQFPVSAGRCTRGAFMQLVQIDESLRQHLRFEFVLVIDTEGLRAIEVASKSDVKHDNELATFVIGLSNMTLINLSGENTSEIEEVIQIAVHAFLRMKKVKLYSRCIFVHQNVGDLTARDKNMEARMRLQQKLDEFTQVAAQQEQCEVTHFNDVIRFDVNKHIHYFPNLWDGDPPMAPRNPEYSRNVEELRNKILNVAKDDSQDRFLSISEFKVRLQDLWRALLNENFVFSFKNALEILAYSELETKVNDWTWQLRQHMLQMQTKCKNRVLNGEITNAKDLCLEDHTQEKYVSITKEVDIYFSQDKSCQLIAQWKTRVTQSLNRLKHECTEEIKQLCKQLISFKSSQTRLAEKRSEYENQLFEQSKLLSLKFRNRTVSDVELREQFNYMFNEWIHEMPISVYPKKELNIRADVEQSFLNHFAKEPNLVSKIMDYSKRESFTLNLPAHVHLRQDWYGSSETLEEHDRKIITKIKDCIEKDINTYIKKIEFDKIGYNSNYIPDILKRINDAIKTSCSSEKWELTEEYTFDLSLYLCYMSADRFTKMHKAWQESNDPLLYLKSIHEDIFNYFQIACQGTTAITTFTNVLCNKIMKAVQPEVHDRAAINLADEMRSNFPAFNGNRSNLERHILISLAEQEDFDKYMDYIDFPLNYLHSYIRQCVLNYYLCSEAEPTNTFLSISLDFFQKLILSAIVKSTQRVKDTHGNASMWLDELCKQFGDTISLSRNELQNIEHQDITDIQFVKDAMIKEWDSTIASQRQCSATMILTPIIDKAHEILTKQLSGCWEKCPFCKATCTNTIYGHDGTHSVPFHRPQVLGGLKWNNTKHLSTSICTSLVASDCTFVVNSKKRILFKNYRQAGQPFANWSIMPDNSNDNYWKWFVCHFRANLEKENRGCFEGNGEIPSEWKQYTKDSVISALQCL